MGQAYPTSKAALNHFARHVAVQEAPKGIRVNVISPGAIVTRMIGQALGLEKGNEEETYGLFLSP